MDENEWLNAMDPQVMLTFLRGKASDRKLRLFACACVRRVWDLPLDERSRKAVEVAERSADGQARAGELARAHKAKITTGTAGGVRLPHTEAVHAVTHATSPGLVEGDYYAPAHAAALAAQAEARAVVFNLSANNRVTPTRIFYHAAEAAQCAQAALLRDIVANPFATPQPIDSAVLRWNDGTVLRIATRIYEERAFERLPVLADALLDAGCDDEDLISHCRSAGPHVRGCYAVDLILGKE
jgi:hypothetical protein